MRRLMRKPHLVWQLLRHIELGANAGDQHRLDHTSMQPTERHFMETITCGSWIGQLGKALAPRELEALLWVAQGLTTKEIARQMAVSPGTVANRIEAALFKLEAGRRIEAVTKAMRQQIISPLCILLVGIMAMHSAVNDGDPIRRDRRAPERRTAQVRIVRRAEAFELHA